MKEIFIAQRKLAKEWFDNLLFYIFKSGDKGEKEYLKSRLRMSILALTNRILLRLNLIGQLNKITRTIRLYF